MCSRRTPLFLSTGGGGGGGAICLSHTSIMPFSLSLSLFLTHTHNIDNDRSVNALHAADGHLFFLPPSLPFQLNAYTRYLFLSPPSPRTSPRYVFNVCTRRPVTLSPSPSADAVEDFWGGGRGRSTVACAQDGSVSSIWFKVEVTELNCPELYWKGHVGSNAHSRTPAQKSHQNTAG